MMSQKTKKRLIILVHEGSALTNLKAIEAAVKNNQINADIIGTFSDSAILPNLDELRPDYVCLAGWKKIIPDEIIEKFKVLNLHPGLIPVTKEGTVLNPDGTLALSNRGLYADKTIQNFLDKKVTYAGSSIHLLTKEFDFGPVLGRTFEKIEPGDTVETLYSRLKKKENELYVEVLSKLAHE
jgi:phosphoribosylglycinamide formyltransferase-1